MTKVEVTAIAQDYNATEAYAVLCDFEHYPAMSEIVLSIKVDRRSDNRAVSTWEVRFRDGVLRWTEEDVFDNIAHTIVFKQLYGDVDDFSGHWRVKDEAGGGCRIIFKADFDMGIPSLSHIIEPIAEQTLRDNVKSTLIALT